MMVEIKKKPVNVIPMMIIGGLFFIFGFITWLNGSLIPFLQIACELNHIEAYFVTMAFYIAYTVMALPMAALLKKTGYKQGMALGLFIMAIGALIFIPAADMRIYSIFLIALFTLATGLTILQTAANPYIVLLGAEETAAVRISIMGLLNKSAGIVAPIIFTAYIFNDMSQINEASLAALSVADRAVELSELSSRLITPYLVMSVVLFILSAGILISPLPELEGENDEREEQQGVFAILRYPQLVFGAITLFFYVGVEVVAGDTIALFGKEMGVSNFAELTSYTMAFMVAAYITGMIVIPRWISQEKALALSGILGMVLTILIIFTSPEQMSIWQYTLAWTGVSVIPNVVMFVAMLGFANALVWPAIWPIALSGLGKHTSTGSALLIMGISGGAILPLLYGISVESIGNAQQAYLIMLPSYLIIFLYAMSNLRNK